MVEKNSVLSPIVVALFHRPVGLDHATVQGTQRMEVYSILVIELKASYTLDKCPATENTSPVSRGCRKVLLGVWLNFL